MGKVGFGEVEERQGVGRTCGSPFEGLEKTGQTHTDGSLRSCGMDVLEHVKGSLQRTHRGRGELKSLKRNKLADRICCSTEYWASKTKTSFD
jgi:hypothetical protein